jgi:hypothetical protein
MANSKANSYIRSMCERFGDDWIVAVKPEDIQRSGKRIVKDMVRGVIDYETYGRYFLDPKFLENLIIAVSNELDINTLYLNAVTFYINNSGVMVPNSGIYITHLQSIYYVYNTILNKLLQVRMEQNIGCLADTTVLLYEYRNHLN